MSSQTIVGGACPVELVRIRKHFGGVQALDDVSLAIAGGEVHALVGENGAGKSTLGKIIVGAHRPDSGTLAIDGHERHYHSPADALVDGVTGIAQEISLVPQRSAMDNVYLGAEPHRAGAVDVSKMRRLYAELEERTRFGIPPDVLAGSLPIADQQRLEIMRALARDARVIVMDEPTAALTETESQKLFDVVRRLREEGTTVIYVSHFLREVLDLADRVTVLRDGKLVRTGIAAEETPESLVTSMLGRALTHTFPPKRPPREDAPVRLKVSGATRTRAFQDVSFEVRAGEIVGLAGLVGAGPTEVARSLFGADRLDHAEIELDGMPARFKSPREAIHGGLAYLTESRKDDGLMLDRSAAENITLPFLSEISRAGFVVGAQERARCTQLLQSVRATTQARRSTVRELSGGNQQKVLFARWLFSPPKVFIADEPTRGVDVGAKVAIYDLVAELAAKGLGVLLISSENEELIGLAHRILVMREGRIVADLRGADMNEDNIVTAALIA